MTCLWQHLVDIPETIVSVRNEMFVKILQKYMRFELSGVDGYPDVIFVFLQTQGTTPI